MSSNLGLSGLASGFNTDSVIQKILDFENKKIIDQQMRKAQAEAKQDAWKQVRSSLQSLRSGLDAIRLGSTFSARSATLSDSSVAGVTVSAGATTTTHTLSVKKLATYHVVAGSNVTDANAAISFAGPYPSDLIINGKTITVVNGDTLTSIKDKINATTDVRVKAEVVKVPVGAATEYRLVLTSATQGSAGAITVTNNALSQSLGLVTGAGALNELSVAQDADFTLNGVNYTSSTNAISDILPGVSLNLKKGGTVDPVSGTITPVTTSITIDANQDQAVAAVEAWVKSLNGTIDLLKEATQYDADAKKKGLLNGEELARSIMVNLRNMVSRTVTGLPATLNQLSQVGITSGAFGSADYGKIVVDRTKLKEALTSDSTGVAKLFGAVQNNVALTGAGAAIDPVDTDVHADPVYDPVNLLNGDSSSDRFEHMGGGWLSPSVPTAGAPQKVTIDLNGSKTIEQIRLYQPDTTNYPASGGLRNFTVEYYGSDAQWHTIESVTNHTGTFKTLNFDPVVATKVRVSVSATYDGKEARLTEVEVNERNDGTAATMFRYLDQTLFKSVSGSLDSRETALRTQITEIGKQIDRLGEAMTRREAQLRQQFSRMEQAISKLQGQGGYLSFLNQMGGSGGQR